MTGVARHLLILTIEVWPSSFKLVGINDGQFIARAQLTNLVCYALCGPA